MLDRHFHFGELICSQFPQLANELERRDRDDVLSVEGPFLQEQSKKGHAQQFGLLAKLSLILSLFIER